MPWFSVDDAAIPRNAMGVPIVVAAPGDRNPGRHPVLLVLHGLVTRHVTGPLLASVRLLQRKVGARQPAASPSAGCRADETGDPW